MFWLIVSHSIHTLTRLDLSQSTPFDSSERCPVRVLRGSQRVAVCSLWKLENRKTTNMVNNARKTEQDIDIDYSQEQLDPVTDLSRLRIQAEPHVHGAC